MTVAGLLAGIGITSCADLGYGVDISSGDANPYWYGNGYLGQHYWQTPVWNYGPAYDMYPPRPWNPGTPPPPAQAPSKPTPPQQTAPNPGNNVPTHVGGVQRPGNGGLANSGPVNSQGASTGRR